LVPLDLERELDLLRIGVRHDEALQRAVFGECVDRAPIRDAWNRKRRDRA
jgi:hypothetical protein